MISRLRKKRPTTAPSMARRASSPINDLSRCLVGASRSWRRHVARSLALVLAAGAAIPLAMADPLSGGVVWRSPSAAAPDAPPASAPNSSTSTSSATSSPTSSFTSSSSASPTNAESDSHAGGLIWRSQKRASAANPRTAASQAPAPPETNPRARNKPEARATADKKSSPADIDPAPPADVLAELERFATPPAQPALLRRRRAPRAAAQRPRNDSPRRQ